MKVTDRIRVEAGCVPIARGGVDAEDIWMACWEPSPIQFAAIRCGSKHQWFVVVFREGRVYGIPSNAICFCQGKRHTDYVHLPFLDGVLYCLC
jgi:hypothetical protein